MSFDPAPGRGGCGTGGRQDPCQTGGGVLHERGCLTPSFSHAVAGPACPLQPSFLQKNDPERMLRCVEDYFFKKSVQE